MEVYPTLVFGTNCPAGYLPTPNPDEGTLFQTDQLFSELVYTDSKGDVFQLFQKQELTKLLGSRRFFAKKLDLIYTTFGLKPRLLKNSPG